MYFLTLALAADGAEGASSISSGLGGLANLLPMVAIFLVFYFLLIRPQMKKQKELQALVSNLKKGDKVIAAGGIIGKISKIEDNIIILEIDTNSKIQVLKSTVNEVLDNKKDKTK